MIAIRQLVFILVIFLAGALAGVSEGAERQVAGWSERVRLFPGNIPLNAKLDTGALTSSLNVRLMETYRRDGETRIKFDFQNSNGKKVTIDRPLVRVAKIKDLGRPLQERPVITIGICLGDRFAETEVTLFDRSGFNFQLLLGRRFLAGRVQVDSAEKRLLKPNCPGEPKP